MIRPKRERPTASSFNKFVKIFGMLMTTLYVMAGVFLIFADEETMNLNMAQNTRYILGGILILYGLVRFVRLYQQIPEKTETGMKNKLNAALLTIAVLAMAACGNSGNSPTDTPTTGKINISVDESFQPIIETQLNTFEGIYKYADITANYKAEGQVVRDLLNDSVRIGVLSRELNTQEKEIFDKKNLVPRNTRIAIDAIAIIVNRNNPDSLITLEQLRKVFNGEINTWQQLNNKSSLKDITIVFDNNNSSTARYVKDSLTTSQKLPQNTFASDSHKALLDYVTQNENAMGVIGVNWISDLDDTTAIRFKRQIKVMGISKNPAPQSTESYYQPYQAYIAQGNYPLIRYLYIVSTEGRNGLGTGFAAYVAGDKGQRIILKSGLVPATMPVRVVGLN